MVSYATVTGRITIPQSDVGIPAKVIATPETKGRALTVNDRVTIGSVTAVTDAAGNLPTSGTTALQIPTNHGIDGLLWRVVAHPLTSRYIDSEVELGVYEITGTSSTPLHSLVQIDQTMVKATAVASLQALVQTVETEVAGKVAQAETARAGAVTARTGAETARDEAEAARDTTTQIALGDAEAALEGFQAARGLPADGEALAAQTAANIEATGPVRTAVEDVAADGLTQPGPVRDAADARVVVVDRRNRFVPLGDSIAAQNGTGPDTVTNTPTNAQGANGPWVWARNYLGQRLVQVGNRGVGGERTDQILARVPATLTDDADVIALVAGMNDVIQNVPAATIIANLDSIITALTSAGRLVVAHTITPADAAAGAWNTSAKRATAATVNAWIRSQTGRRRVIVVDAWRVIVDPTTGLPAAGATIDGVHPSWRGAERIGREIARVLAPVFPPLPGRMAAAIDADSAVSAAMLNYSAFGTNGNTKLALAVGTREDAEAKKLTVTITGETVQADNFALGLENVSGGKFAPGDTVQAAVNVEWSGVTFPTSGNGYFTPRLALLPRLAAGAFTAETAYAVFLPSGSYTAWPNPMPAAGSARLLTNRLVVPSGVDRLYVHLGATGVLGGTFTFTDLAVRRIV